MNILVDIDGVLADVVSATLEVLKTKYDQCHGKTAEDWTTYHLEECSDVTQETLKEIYSDWTFHRDIAPMPMTQWMMRHLSRMGDVHIVTARGTFDDSHGRIREITVKWLKDNRIRFDHISFTRAKAKYALAADIDLAIEDSPTNALDLSCVCPTILVAAPYTKDVKPFRSFHVNRTPEEIVKIARTYRDLLHVNHQ